MYITNFTVSDKGYPTLETTFEEQPHNKKSVDSLKPLLDKYNVTYEMVPLNKNSHLLKFVKWIDKN